MKKANQLLDQDRSLTVAKKVVSEIQATNPELMFYIKEILLNDVDKGVTVKSGVSILGTPLLENGDSKNEKYEEKQEVKETKTAYDKFLECQTLESSESEPVGYKEEVFDEYDPFMDDLKNHQSKFIEKPISTTISQKRRPDMPGFREFQNSDLPINEILPLIDPKRLNWMAFEADESFRYPEITDQIKKYLKNTSRNDEATKKKNRREYELSIADLF